MHAHAHALWIVGETLMLLFLALALASIVRDFRHAWPAIVAALKGEGR